ncbi:MAG: hypothetical protein H7247_13390 [Polaromonas sp.]|nr:hypothetical protein [Gemmatimonadaceae bacterium]
MRNLAVLALALGLAACATDATAPSTSVEGSYSLQRINGTALPYTFSNGVQLVSDRLVLGTDGTFTDIARYGNGQSSTEVGYYTSLNGSITFNDQTSGITYQGSLSGTVLTQIVSGFTQTYQKN